jgi:hypothetical protein
MVAIRVREDLLRERGIGKKKPRPPKTALIRLIERMEGSPIEQLIFGPNTEPIAVLADRWQVHPTTISVWRKRYKAYSE